MSIRARHRSRRRIAGKAMAAIAFAILLAPQPAASIVAGIDYAQLCRQTAHVPLVHASIDPAYINVWSEQESLQVGRYEQYSFRSRRIDVRRNDNISLYHGLIHRTLDLMGESLWRYRDFDPDEDREHWLIYYTLETNWPGRQRRQGEPSRAALRKAMEYWTANSEAYARLNAKAAALASVSWCAAYMPRPAPRPVAGS